MHINMGMKISVNFGCRKIYQEISCMFVGTGIGMPMYPGNRFFMKFSCLKFGLLENSQENAGSIIPKLLWPVVGHVLVSST